MVEYPDRQFLLPGLAKTSDEICVQTDFEIPANRELMWRVKMWESGVFDVEFEFVRRTEYRIGKFLF